MPAFLAAVVVLMLAGTATAQSYGPPEYSVGDTWIRKAAGKPWEVKVVNVEGDHVWMQGAFRDCPTCVVLLDRSGAFQALNDADGKPVDVTKYRFVPMGSAWKLWEFPLEAGKKWQFVADGYFQAQPVRYTVECRVEALEDIKTPAGTFKAYRVQRNWTSEGRRGPGFAVTWQDATWFAPAVKGPVKFTSTGRGATEWERQSYTVK
jgi:hypothetical protein